MQLEQDSSNLAPIKKTKPQPPEVADATDTFAKRLRPHIPLPEEQEPESVETVPTPEHGDNTETTTPHHATGKRAITTGRQEEPKKPTLFKGALRKAGILWGRFSHQRCGQFIYMLTGGSFGILPRTYGKGERILPGNGKLSTLANRLMGDGLLVLERKTAPFSQLLPGTLREKVFAEHYLSIGAFPPAQGPKDVVRAFRELMDPLNLKHLGMGEPGGPAGFRVVTDQAAFIAWARQHMKNGWTVEPYEETAGMGTRIGHWLQLPATWIGNLTGTRGEGPKQKKCIITWNYSESIQQNLPSLM